MFKITEKEVLNPTIVRMKIHAPLIAKKAQPGQFIIFRVDEHGERVPLTIADYDRESGEVTIIFQLVGRSTIELANLSVGESIADFVGPLGKASDFQNVTRAAVVGGGLGTAIALPQARGLYDMGADVDVIVGFRNKDLIILSEDFKQISTHLYEMTDDGSNGHKGFVTDALQTLLEDGNRYDVIVAIGPLPMMKAVCQLTRPYGIKTVVSMNTMMVDGTGMCGSCRLTVGDEIKFACVDGPDFDGHLVDFDEAIARSRVYEKQEKESMEEKQCKLLESSVQ